ncbi:MAG: ABC transporter ATP-binding protein [Phycisphaerales bacterium]|nr:ABC transporter ATP-binding protein [Phycisphaerales bacterium]
MTSAPPHPAPAPPPAPAREPVLRVRNLTTRFRTERGMVTAVDDVSFDLYPGETLGIVGESGCGKTVTSKSIMRLLPENVTRIDPASRIEFAGRNLASLPEHELRRVRGEKIAMIFQEPMTSLNPVFRVGWQLDEALRLHTRLNRAERRAKVIEMLRIVEIPSPENRMDDYPHQLSGGMRQRVMIAMALCCEPDILIADEPTTALDVTIQAQILDLMESLKRKTRTAIMLITHNLGVVAQVCDRVMVMYAGRVIESGSVRDIFHRARHPYTRALLESIPKKGGRVKGARLPAIGGMVPSLFNLPKGCRFSDRCGFVQDRCRAEEPTFGEHGAAAHPVRCHFPIETPVKISVRAAP